MWRDRGIDKRGRCRGPYVGWLWVWAKLRSKYRKVLRTTLRGRTSTASYTQPQGVDRSPSRRPCISCPPDRLSP